MIIGGVMAPMARDYGQRIRRRRQELGLSQKQLGEQVGVSESAVISWEKYRHAPTRKQGAIEAVLGISLDGDRPEPADPDRVKLRGALDRLRETGLKDLDSGTVQAMLELYDELRQRPVRNSGASTRAS